ncbi:pathogen-associated molecular patterns-induced protein A70-like [Abrus precatorius]|uniref:Pathogen-associated molecular patterns-induced protein A70-like n=1 Tax=Abrus precatorius TaxID=3816 RepID=A0A8B8MLH1_ABRPR|nr:pathogen-associated molecular patterns-induced protein A70-like [Abrus precatorius]
MADSATLIATWFTPSSVFIVVNLVIATIALTSRFTKQLHQPQPQRLVRTPSLLERVSSFNFALYKHQPTHAEIEHIQPQGPEPEPENPQLIRTPSLLQRLQSMNFSRFYRSEEEDPGRDSGNSELRKSASENAGSVKGEWEDEGSTVEQRRPATARGGMVSWRGDEEVDAKADDFINRFKKQLRLQRVDSVLRYREMLRRGKTLHTSARNAAVLPAEISWRKIADNKNTTVFLPSMNLTALKKSISMVRSSVNLTFVVLLVDARFAIIVTVHCGTCDSAYFYFFSEGWTTGNMGLKFPKGWC